MVVSNGRELLKVMENARFDLVLMDCQMPEMDGFAATAEIRRREGNTRHTIIIAMTANALDGDDQRCLAAGMDDYLSKPVKAELLRLKLERWGNPSSVATHSNGTRAQQSTDPKVAAGSEQSGVIDRSRLDVYRELQEPGAPDFVTELIDLFVSETDKQMKKLHAADLVNNEVEIRRLAHYMRSSSASIGALQMTALYEQLERIESADGNVRVLLNELTREFAFVRTALTAERQ